MAETKIWMEFLMDVEHMYFVWVHGDGGDGGGGMHYVKRLIRHNQ